MENCIEIDYDEFMVAIKTLCPFTINWGSDTTLEIK
jgi:hypothetical protein